jgi:hypothetical protein
MVKVAALADVTESKQAAIRPKDPKEQHSTDSAGAMCPDPVLDRRLWRSPRDSACAPELKIVKEIPERYLDGR